MKANKLIWIINGILIGLLILVVCILLFGGWNTTISLKGTDHITLEYGTVIQDPGAEARFSGNLVLKKGISVPVTIDTSELEAADLGTYTITYSAGVAGASAKVERTVEIVDTTPPQIQLETIDDYYTRPGDPYEEEGFSAIDLYDGDMTSQVIRSQTEAEVTYEVTDSSGNTASVIRPIVYDDRVAPEIMLEGETDVTLEKGTHYEESGFSASDDCDGDITHLVAIEKQSDGWIYTVSDSYDNKTTVVRKITYIDTLPPELTLNEGGEIWMKAGQEFVDPGYTALDQGDGDLSTLVAVSGEVDRYHSGDYTLTYSVEDTAGNVAEVQRIVHVEPRTQPDVVQPGNKVVYLTFDDGPGEYTQALLDVLEEYNVKATFFVTGANSEYFSIIGAAARAGHSIGLHSYSHKYDEIYVSEDAYFEDLAKIQAIVKQQTGKETTLIRFPGGSSNTVSDYNPGIMTSLTQAVTDMGYQYFDWNVDSDDAGSATDAKTVAWNVCYGMYQKNVSVVLQHDIKAYSVEAVEAILAWGIENGYTFLPLTSNSPTAHHVVNN